MVDITEHLQLVHWAIKHHFQKRVRGRIEYDDVFQAGCLGLIRAAEKFDPERGIKFSTYAMWWVTSFIRRHIQCCGRLVRVSVNVQEQGRAPPELVSYLDAPISASCEGTRHEVTGADDPEHEQRCMRADLDGLVERLPLRLRRVIRLRLRGYLLDDVAREFGVTRSRAGQMEAEAMKQMHAWTQKPLRLSRHEAITPQAVEAVSRMPGR